LGLGRNEWLLDTLLQVCLTPTPNGLTSPAQRAAASAQRSPGTKPHKQYLVIPAKAGIPLVLLKHTETQRGRHDIPASLRDLKKAGPRLRGGDGD